MRIAIAILLLVTGSILFHLLSPWWQTPIASDWRSIDTALNITLWICGAAFVGLNLFLASVLIRYRNRPGHKAHYEPENRSLEKRLTFWTAVGIVGMLAPGLSAWSKYVTVPDDAAMVEAVGQQWQWSFRFPGQDSVFGAAAAKHVTPENPLGIDPLDPFGRDDIVVEGDELHLPVGRPIKVILRSKDVLHDFYVPEFRAKMDLVPGLVSYFWLKPTLPGTYGILCAELSGVGHHAMRGSVVVDPPADFSDWLSGQTTFSELIAEASPSAQAALFATSNACVAPIGGAVS